jgi:hypothetical protein
VNGDKVTPEVNRRHLRAFVELAVEARRDFETAVKKNPQAYDVGVNAAIHRLTSQAELVLRDNPTLLSAAEKDETRVALRAW